MKRKLIALAALAACTALAMGEMTTPDGWTDDFDAAKAQAAKEGKSLLVYFYRQTPGGFAKSTAGHDSAVFLKKEFIEAAKKDYVLVNVELPPRGESSPSEKMKRNLELADKYNAKIFLSLLEIIDANGEVLVHRPPYIDFDTDPEKYLKHVNAMKAAGIASKEFMKAVASLEKGSPERLAKIDDVFQKIGEEEARRRLELHDFAKERLEKDEDGAFAAKYPYFAYVAPAERKMRELYAPAGKQEPSNVIQTKIAETRKAIEDIKSSAPESIREEIDDMLRELNWYEDRMNGKSKPGKAK